MSRNKRRRTTPLAAASSSYSYTAAGVSFIPKPDGTPSEIEEIEPFPRFDVISDDSDHFYHQSTRSIPSRTEKKIMQEWKLLEQHLPESITVRAYEKRVGLLRAAIVGASATPYHDGLYFFDISFPADYPTQPPLVHYRSFGYRINPNLYTSGKVCLSLLNTWDGKRSERWNPKESTILQVLLSIQALVLNERPYYNEPGFGSFKPGSSGENKSFAYNEHAFIFSCKSMLGLIKNPPRGFEVFVPWHFRGRARAILGACKAYAEGRVRVGYFLDGAPQGSSKVGVPEKFKESIKSLYPQLYRTFSKEGAPLAGFSEELTLDEPPCQGNPPPVPPVPPAPAVPPAPPAPVEVKKGLVVNVLRKVKNFFGLK